MEIVNHNAKTIEALYKTDVYLRINSLESSFDSHIFFLVLYVLLGELANLPCL